MTSSSAAWAASAGSERIRPITQIGPISRMTPKINCFMVLLPGCWLIRREALNNAVEIGGGIIFDFDFPPAGAFRLYEADLGSKRALQLLDERAHIGIHGR